MCFTPLSHYDDSCIQRFYTCFVYISPRVNRLQCRYRKAFRNEYCIFPCPQFLSCFICLGLKGHFTCISFLSLGIQRGKQFIFYSLCLCQVQCMNRLPSVLFVHMQKFVFYELIRSKNSCSVHVHGSNCRDADSE